MAEKRPPHNPVIHQPRQNATSLNHLPDDILLRIISLTGKPGTQVGNAYSLGAVSSRLRRLLKTQFLTSITHLSMDWITSLSLSDAQAARRGLASMFASTPAVKELNLNGCSPDLLDRNCLSALAQSARHALTTVNLAYCRLTDDVVRPLLQCPNLRKLILVRCDGLTGNMFDDGCCNAPLELLDLSWVPTLTLDGVLAVAKVVTLKELIVTGCDAVNSKTIRAFTKSDICNSLTSICLAHCPLKERSLFELLESMPNLTSLTLSEYTGNIWVQGDFSAACIGELRSMFPGVDIRFTI